MDFGSKAYVSGLKQASIKCIKVNGLLCSSDGVPEASIVRCLICHFIDTSPVSF